MSRKEGLGKGVSSGGREWTETRCLGVLGKKDGKPLEEIKQDSGMTSADE